MNRNRLLKKRARKLPRRMLEIAASKGSGRSGKHGWRDNLASTGAASEVRILVKDGKPVDGRI